MTECCCPFIDDNRIAETKAFQDKLIKQLQYQCILLYNRLYLITGDPIIYIPTFEGITDQLDDNILIVTQTTDTLKNATKYP